MTREEQKSPASATTTDVDPREARRIAYVIYAILIIGMAAQFSLYTFAPGTVAVVCAIIYAYIQRKELYGTLFENHYRWITRSFWIGGAVYLPIATVLMVIYQMIRMDMTEMFRAMYEGEKDTLRLAEILIDSNAQMLLYSAAFVGFAFAIWWWARCFVGLYYLRRGSPLPKVTRWL